MSLGGAHYCTHSEAMQPKHVAGADSVGSKKETLVSCLGINVEELVGGSLETGAARISISNAPCSGSN